MGRIPAETASRLRKARCSEPCDVAVSSNFAHCSLFQPKRKSLFILGRVTPMSIQEFHSQLPQSDQPNARMSTLSRLTQAADPQVGEQLAETDDWGLGAGGRRARSAGTPR